MAKCTTLLMEKPQQHSIARMTDGYKNDCATILGDMDGMDLKAEAHRPSTVLPSQATASNGLLLFDNKMDLQSSQKQHPPIHFSLEDKNLPYLKVFNWSREIQGLIQQSGQPCRITSSGLWSFHKILQFGLLDSSFI